MKTYSLSEIIKALEYGDEAGAYGSLAPAADPAVFASAQMETYMDAVRRKAGGFVGTPIPCLPFSQYKKIALTGERTGYEKIFFGCHSTRLAIMGIMALAERGKPDESLYISELEDIMWAFCDQYIWSLPAHHGENALKVQKGELYDPSDDFLLKAYVPDKEQMVDLDTATSAFNLAELLYLFRGQLEPVVVHRVRENIVKRFLEPLSSLNACPWWEIHPNNWAAVCAGCMADAAMYMIKEPRMLAPFIRRACDAMAVYLDSFPEDGVCEEGVGYWGYGFSHFVVFADLLKKRTAGKIDLFQDETVYRISRFPEQVALLDGGVVSFADGNMKATFPLELLHRLKEAYPELPLPSPEFCEGEPDMRYFSPLLRHFAWVNPQWLGSPGYPDGCRWGEAAEWMTSRRTFGNIRAAFACKGGHNGVSHNHNDVGTFLLNIEGEQLLADVGSGEYTRQYFSPERYGIFNCGSQGHSVPVIDGGYQLSGQEHRAEGTRFASGEDWDTAEMGLASAYGCDKLQSLHRVMEFGGDGRLILKDRYRFSDTPSEVRERLICLYRPAVEEDGSVRMAGGKGQALRLEALGWIPMVTEAETYAPTNPLYR